MLRVCACGCGCDRSRGDRAEPPRGSCHYRHVVRVIDGRLRIWARLADVEGEAVLAAILRRAKQAPAAGTLEQRRADALVEICSLALGADADPDRATVVAHVTADGTGTLAGGTRIAAETVDRLSCDGRICSSLPDGRRFSPLRE